MNHPVYEKMKAESLTQKYAPYLDTADAAKCIRSTLKARFPGTKFSVKIERYSGGSSVNVQWTDGPVLAMVEPIVDAFSGKGFDGMIDMAYYKTIFLMPDGSAAFAETSGTEGSMGTVPAAKEWKPAPEAIRVSPSCYIFANRKVSKEAMERAIAAYGRKFGDELGEAIRSGKVKVEDSPYGGYTIESARSYQGSGSGSQYDGASCLYQFAARRMVAA